MTAFDKDGFLRRAGDPLLFVKEVTASTNDDIKALCLDGAAHGTAVLALSQTAGRGRMGRVFDSREGGLYLSFLVRGAQALDPVRLTVSAAVAAARALERVASVKVGIKWVNDLWLGEKKCAGILAEGIWSPSPGEPAAAVGIGVNLSNPLPPELADKATSVLAYAGTSPDVGDLALALLRELRRVFSPDEPLPFDEYARRMALFGRRVKVSAGEEVYFATVRRLMPDGALCVETDAGEERLLRFGEVSLS